ITYLFKSLAARGRLAKCDKAKCYRKNWLEWRAGPRGVYSCPKWCLDTAGFTLPVAASAAERSTEAQHPLVGRQAATLAMECDGRHAVLRAPVIEETVAC